MKSSNTDMTIQALQKVEKPQLIRERAFDDMRDAIISGKIAPGTRLIERELCEALGISRASVREVIRQLQAERLIKVEPRKGPIVALLDRKEAIELYDVRSLFEVLLVVRFTEIATDGDIARIEEIYERISRASRLSDVQSLARLMVEFDSYLNLVVQHDIIGDLLDQLNARISVLRLASMSYPGRIMKGEEEIGVIVDAIRQRDGIKAGEAMKRYVANACADALKTLPTED